MEKYEKKIGKKNLKKNEKNMKCPLAREAGLLKHQAHEVLLFTMFQHCSPNISFYNESVQFYLIFAKIPYVFQ